MKVKKETVKTLSDEVLEKVLSKPKKSTATFAQFRDRAIMWTLFDTGVRLNELVNIQVNDVKLDDGYIHITLGKGQKERPVGVSRTLSKVLKEYLDILQPENFDDYVFCNSYGGQISTSTMRKRFSDYGKEIGMKDMKLSAHKFRYTFSKHWIKNGGDPFRLQKALGHSSMEMVRNYVEMFNI